MFDMNLEHTQFLNSFHYIWEQVKDVQIKHFFCALIWMYVFTYMWMEQGSSGILIKVSLKNSIQ